jgi:hypothetical protein
MELPVLWVGQSFVTVFETHRWDRLVPKGKHQNTLRMCGEPAEDARARLPVCARRKAPNRAPP